ncbi:MAG: PDZ domain-containing protein [Clostridia bacterium]|nr:PDZ domain-containing protein [Clostridia bacterium]
MKKVLKKTGIIFLLVFLFTALIYVSDISNLPSNVILFEGEALRLNTIFGVELETKFSSNPNIERIENFETVTVSAEVKDKDNADYTETINLDVKVLGAKVKEINVNVIEKLEVVPLGNLIGVKLYTNGVLVVGMSEISGTDDSKHKPYENSGIEEGDIISKINDKDITCTNDLTTQINKSKGEDMSVTYIRNRRSKKCNNEGH